MSSVQRGTDKQGTDKQGTAYTERELRRKYYQQIFAYTKNNAKWSQAGLIKAYNKLPDEYAQRDTFVSLAFKWMTMEEHGDFDANIEKFLDDNVREQLRAKAKAAGGTRRPQASVAQRQGAPSSSRSAVNPASAGATLTTRACATPTIPRKSPSPKGAEPLQHMNPSGTISPEEMAQRFPQFKGGNPYDIRW